jgi:hypothetical protein
MQYSQPVVDRFGLRMPRSGKKVLWLAVLVAVAVFAVVVLRRASTGAMRSAAAVEAAPPETALVGASNTERDVTAHVATAGAASHDPAAILALLRTANADRWQVAWRDYFAGMPPLELWNLVSRPELIDQPEAKMVREQIARSCLLGLVREQQHKDGRDLLMAWCEPFVALGGDAFMREQTNALVNDEVLRSAPFSVLELKHFRGSRQEREEEQAFLETTFRRASDPWSLRASTFSLFAYRSTLVSDDWSEFEMLSRDQRYRLGWIVSMQAACRETRDCGVRSVWTAELCATVKGFVCRDGEDFSQIIARNVSPIELALINRIGMHIATERAVR